MAMTVAGMTAKIVAEMNAQGFNLSHPDTNGEGMKYVEALSKAIVEYIQSNAKAEDGGGTGAANWPIR